MSKFLVTGGAGFIGSNVVRELLTQGHSVRILDNFSTGRHSNIAEVLGDIELVEGDLTSYERVHTSIRGMEYVLHLGALPSVPRSVQDPLTTSQVNITGTLNVMLASRDEGIKRVVYASSSSVYGDTPALPKVESMPATPMSPYAVAKLCGEGYCRAFTQVYGLETVALRYFNVFGPRQDPQSQYSAVIPKFIRLMSAGRRPPVTGDGENSRDFTYIDNVVQATIAAATAAERAVGMTMNIACGERFSLNYLVSALNEVLGSTLEPEYVDERPGDVRHSQADIQLARDLLGYDPTVCFEDGLRNTANHIASSSN